MNNRFRVMNSRLRKNMHAIIFNLESKEPIDEDTIQDIKSKLLNIEAETGDDIELIKTFYATVRKQGSIRDSLSETHLPALLPRAALSKEHDTDVPIIITETRVLDRYSAIKNYSVAENLKIFKKYSHELHELLQYKDAANEKKQARYFLHANKIVASYRYLMRILGVLPWAKLEDRTYFLNHLTALYNRLEDYGWLCEGSQALGLLPLKQNASEYDERDFEKKLARFMDALQSSSNVTPYPRPVVSLEKLISRLDKLVVENNQVIVRKGVASSSTVKGQHLESQCAPVSALQTVGLFRRRPGILRSVIAPVAHEMITRSVKK
jgi:hypothetical protein